VSGLFVERDRCPGCAGARGETLFECAYSDDPIRAVVRGSYPTMSESDLERIGHERYILDRCSRCGLVWQRYAPGPAILTQLYESWSEPEQLHERQDTLRHGQSYAQEVMLVLEHFGDPPSAIWVLDFGSGWGRWPRMAAAFGCQAHGADLSADQTTWAGAQGVTMIDAPRSSPPSDSISSTPSRCSSISSIRRAPSRHWRTPCVLTACSRSASRTPRISTAALRGATGTR